MTLHEIGCLVNVIAKQNTYGATAKTYMQVEAFYPYAFLQGLEFYFLF
jgi:hypothetical protein